MDINSAVGRKAGLNDEELQAVAGSDLSLFTDVERLVIALADALSDTPSNVSDALYAQLRVHFSEEQLIELGAQIAFEQYRQGSIGYLMSAVYVTCALRGPTNSALSHALLTTP